MMFFNNTKGVKVKIFEVLVRHGILNAEELYYTKRESGTPFSLKDFIHEALSLRGVVGVNEEDLYNEIVAEFPRFVNNALLALIQEMGIGKDDCYIITSGEEGYQNDKIEGSGLSTIFNAPRIVSNSKKREVERICREFGEEEIIFVDDKDKFFSELNMENCQNLKTVLYNEHGLENLKAEIEEGRREELAREQKRRNQEISQTPPFPMK